MAHDHAYPSSLVVDVERIRVRVERDIVGMLQRAPVFDLFARSHTSIAAEPLRRELLARGLRLTESMAPELHEAARLAASRLGVTTPCEIYQSTAASENAAIHLVEAPVLLEVQGRLLAGLDAGTRLAVLGHELGHYLAHGPWTPVGRVHLAARQLALQEDADIGLLRAASVLWMAGELTADRFGLLACRDLDAALRLEMMAATGLSGDALTWDTNAYLAQVKELIENCLAAGDGARGLTHPEHGLRAYALFLFSESAEYRALTGLGPGTRTLEEIDAVLERFLARDDLDLDFDVLDAPPPELHECALASSVLVALSDGDLVEDEQLAIERIFAPLVPGFRAVLDREVALETFYRTGGIVAAHGPSMLRSLFQLLMHVIVADCAVDPREAAMVLAIGEALGCLPMFEGLLAAALRGLGVSFEPKAVPRPELPLPPRSAEAKAALDAFFASMARRGGGETSLRRLVRLLGATRPSADAMRQITRATERAGLRPEQPLDAERIDDRIRFVSTKPHQAPAEPRRVEDADRRALTRAIARLRDHLVSGDGRSPSVRVREARRGRAFDIASLDRVSTGLAERVLAQVRAGKRANLVTAEEVGRHDGARRVADELIELDREQTSRVEETGADDIYLGYPVLTGVADGYLYRAPLVLHPVDLVREARGARGFAIAPRADEPPIVNQSLIRLVFHKKRFALPEALRTRLDELAADETQGAEAIAAELSSLGLGAVKLQGTLVPLRNRDEELAQKREHCEIEECALLGLFPQSSSDLLQDYDALLEDLEKPDADLASLLGAAEELLPARLRGAAEDFRSVRLRDAGQDLPPVRLRGDGREDAERLVDSIQPALHADPSQREVMGEARRARALVVDGPPGTGKSQVIANLIVDALARGERVAVVCEKRAALDVVVQRIDQLGLRQALGVVHDVHLDRKGLYAQVAARFEAEPTSAFDAARHDAVESEARRIESVLAERTALLAAAVPGTKLTIGQLHTLVAGIEAPDLGGMHALERIDEATRDTLEHALVAVAPYADLVGPGRVFHAPEGAAPRPSLASLERPALDALGQTLAGAAKLALDHERLASASPALSADVVRASSLLDAALASRAARSDLEGQRLLAQMLGAAERGEDLANVQQAATEWQRHREAALAVAATLTEAPDVDLERRVEILRAWAGRFLRFFVVAWWTARSFVKRSLPAYLPDRVGHPLESSVLDALRARLSAARAWKALRDGLAAVGSPALVPPRAELADALADRLATLARTASLLVEGRSLLTAAGAYPDAPTLDGVVRWEEKLDQRIALRDAARALAQKAGELSPYFPWLGAHPASATLIALRDALARDGARLVEADRRLDRARSLFDGSDALFDALCAATRGEPDGLGRTLLRAWAQDTLSAFERRDPRLVDLAARTPLGPEPELGRRLAELEQARASLQIDRARSMLDSGAILQAGQAPPRRRRTAEQATREAMLKEAKKQRRVMPLRAFVRRFADEGLLDVIPVWLLSPETMTILFPREPLFDCVIFDEASQCTVESGFPVLLRAERVVIAGDDKQMPPTSFFTSRAADDEDDENEEVREERDLLTDESLLTLASTRVPRRRLAWHYRCRHESLIAFSNHAMYEGQLLTVPSTMSPKSSPVLRWHAVPDGRYHEGRNRVEADQVVTLLHELLCREPCPSLGVVTFNLQQRAAVLEAIDARRAQDPDFGTRWDRASSHEQIDQRPFVKNLESVQGDERDVIVFSLGHAPIERRRRDGSTETYVPARFGPLGVRGGERRLNVAISRAKSECIVVASFEPAQLSVANSRHAGPGLLKRYLEYAYYISGGRHAQAERTLAFVRESRGPAATSGTVTLPCKRYVPLATQIALALEREGIATEMNVGTSAFRIPLAIVDSRDPTRFRIAVMTDEGDAQPSPFELHVHRPLALTQRGFDVMRVTAVEWRVRQGAVVEELRRRLG
jgi:hypothetical protein